MSSSDDVEGFGRTPQLMLDAIGQAVVALDLTGSVTYWNAAAQTCFGWSALEAIGRNVADLIRPDLSDDEAVAIFNGMRTGDPWSAETIVERRDGSRFPALLAGSGIYADDGQLCAIIGVTTDLTSLKQAESARLESERQLQLVVAQENAARLKAGEDALRTEARWHALVSQSADAAVIADATTTAITYVSPAVTRLFGWQPIDVIGRLGLSLVHPDDVTRVTDALSVIGEDPSAHVTIDFRLLCADGTYRWVEETISNLTDVAGVHGLVGNIRDITDRREAEATLQRRDKLTRALAAKASDIALVVGRGDGRIRYLNPSASSVFVGAEGDALNFRSLSYVHPDDRDMVRETLRGIAAVGSTAHVTYRRLGTDGEWRWVEQVLTNCEDDPDIQGLVVNIREITDQVEAGKALQESETRYRLIAETAQEGIWATGPDGRTLYANQKMADLLGCSTLDFYTKPTWELVPATTREGFEEQLRARELDGPDTYELPHVRPDGSTRLLRFSVSPFRDEGKQLGSLGMVSDITEAREAEEKLRHRAFHDQLTGLANRASLVEQLQNALDDTSTDSLAVLVADIDQFKLINDSYGHASGDGLLIEISRRWERELGPRCLVARLGGDEFVAMCQGADEVVARALAARLLRTFETPIELDGRSLALSASIGIAVSSGSADAETLLGYADAAMYEAKARGRSRTEVFTPRLIDRAQSRLRLFNDLKAAIEHDDLRLHYQPVVELATGRLVGVEALCRWTHPERGAVPPDDFIKAAEDNGLIESLDRWALQRACLDGAVMRRAGVIAADVYVAVNVSAASLAQPGFEGAIQTALIEADLPAETLVLEVTESAVMHDPNAAQIVLESLNRLGIRVAIDDFGTGYSSLAYLRRFPVDTLKIDRSFVQHITRNSDDRAIVTAVINLADALNVTTTAEGIETADDLSLLQQLGCLCGQGFLFSPALPPAQLAALLDALPLNRFAVGPGRKLPRPPRLPGPRDVTRPQHAL